MRSSIDAPRLVTVAGQPKGDVYRKHGRWHWYRNNGATQGWHRSCTLNDVRACIARDCLARTSDVIVARPRQLQGGRNDQQANVA